MKKIRLECTFYSIKKKSYRQNLTIDSKKSNKTGN